MVHSGGESSGDNGGLLLRLDRSAGSDVIHSWGWGLEVQYAGKSDDAEREPQAPLLLFHITGGGTGAPSSPDSAASSETRFAAIWDGSDGDLEVGISQFTS